MKRLAFAVCVVVFVFAVAISAQTQPQPAIGTVEQELIKLENGWNDAMVKHDWAFLDQIIADDWIWTDFDGNVWTKTQSLASLKSGEDVYTAAVADEIKVRVYGDVAVTTGRNTIKETLKGKDISGQYRWTDMWVKHAGRWQCVVGHSSRITQK